jgi:hypothetical protein
VKTKVGEIIIARSMADNNYLSHGNHIIYDVNGDVICIGLYEHGICVKSVTYGNIKDGKRPILYEINNNTDGIIVSTYHLGNIDVSCIIDNDRPRTYSVIINGVQHVKFTDKEFDDSNELSTQYRFAVSIFKRDLICGFNSNTLYEHRVFSDLITCGNIKYGKWPILYENNTNDDGITVSSYHLGSMDISCITGKDNLHTYSVMTNGIQDVKFTEKEFDNSDALATQYRFVVSMFE